MSTKEELTLLAEIVDSIKEEFQHPLTVNTDLEEMSVILQEVMDRMRNNYPYFDEKYAGQMLKPPHPIARLSYFLAMYINPNNHALDGGRASSEMEKEAVTKIAEMFGWVTHLGHLTGGGTMANMEALWVAKKEHPDKIVVASEMAHYTHQRISDVLNLGFKSIKCDHTGKMSILGLIEQLKKGDVGTVVVTMGTTGTGSVDALTEIIELQSTYNFRIHVDAAYGGYFKLCSTVQDKKEFELINHADSIVIDPHKHGLQPYGCGCILYKDVQMGRHYKHDSPYTYFSSAELHLGEISLECSRAGASAVALWATLQMFPLENNGKFAQGLNQCIEAAAKLSNYIKNSNHSKLLMEPSLDIVNWAPLRNSLSAMSQASTDIFEKAAAKGVHLALFKYPARLLPTSWRNITYDCSHVTLLRSCLMKFEHNQWVDTIWTTIDQVSRYE